MEFTQTLEELKETVVAMAALVPAIDESLKLILRSLKCGGKVLTCGNGGSAADAFHLAEELVGRYRNTRRALPAVCLNSDSTVITCIANDFGYNRVFSRQVEAIGKAGDVLVVFTTSGKSENVLEAVRVASQMRIDTVALTGNDGGLVRSLVSQLVCVPSANTARIQEMHTVVLHHWLEVIDTMPW